MTIKELFEQSNATVDEMESTDMRDICVFLHLSPECKYPLALSSYFRYTLGLKPKGMNRWPIRLEYRSVEL